MGLRDDIRNFVVDNFLFGEEEGLSNDSSFVKEGIVDSTGILQLVAFIQERYLIPVEDDDLVPENLDSITRVAAFIERKQLAGAGAPSD